MSEDSGDGNDFNDLIDQHMRMLTASLSSSDAAGSSDSAETIVVQGVFVSTPRGPALTIRVREETASGVRISCPFSIIGQPFGFLHDETPGLRLSRRQLDEISALCDHYLESEPTKVVVNEVLHRFSCELLSFLPR